MALTVTELSHIQASEFCKVKWNTIRGMDVESGKFLTEDRPGPDGWQKMARSDRIIKKRSGDPAFGDTRLDDCLASVVPKSVFKDETQLFNTQRAMGALGHMVFSASEGFSNLYKKMGDFVNNIIGPPLEVNPDYDEEQDDGTVPKFIFSPRQNSHYDEFLSMQEDKETGPCVVYVAFLLTPDLLWGVGVRVDQEVLLGLLLLPQHHLGLDVGVGEEGEKRGLSGLLHLL